MSSTHRTPSAAVRTRGRPRSVGAGSLARTAPLAVAGTVAIVLLPALPASASGQRLSALATSPAMPTAQPLGRSAGAATAMAGRLREGSAADSLDALLARAQSASPTLHAARARVDAARARITPAGLWPDPVLMAGVQNVPVSEPGFQDFMTMKMVGLGQSVPYPGKLASRRRAATIELSAAEAALAAAARQVEREVRGAYYELAYLDQALTIVGRSQRVLGDFVEVAEARYSTGQAGQQDVLRARVEATRLAEQAVALSEQRRGALARLNAALDRPTDTPVAEPQLPARIARAAVSDSASRIRFVSAALGARAADSPLPSLAQLQELAVRESPVLREQGAMIAAQGVRVDLARREYLPDIDVSVQYGQRRGLSDMVTATVSVPLPVQKRGRQDQLVAESRAELAALEAERTALRNELRAEVARLYSELERQRAQLALYVKALLPQGRAALTSAKANYQVGRVEFLTVLDNQATLFNYETAYFRSLTDFATTLAELERVVGTEVL